MLRVKSVDEGKANGLDNKGNIVFFIAFLAFLFPFSEANHSVSLECGVAISHPSDSNCPGLHPSIHILSSKLAKMKPPSTSSGDTSGDDQV